MPGSASAALISLLSRSTIGGYPHVGLLDARRVADGMRREVSEGGNPVARKRRNRADAGGKTFGALAQRYLIEHAARRKRSHQRDARNLELHVLPHWRDRPYSSIRRADVIELATDADWLSTIVDHVRRKRVQAVNAQVLRRT